MATRDGEIRSEIKKKYAQASKSPESLFAYPTGRNGAEGLNYPPELIKAAPAELLEGFCGVGNPFVIAPIGLGDSILDLGCGAGFDLYCASRMVGSGGFPVGVDLTPEMAARAARLLSGGENNNVQVICGAAEELPVAPNTFDIVISNGVLNLSPQKPMAFDEIFRVLRPGGRLQFADIILKEKFPEEEKSARSWSE